MFRFESLEVWKKAIEIADKLLDIADQNEAANRCFGEIMEGWMVGWIGLFQPSSHPLKKSSFETTNAQRQELYQSE